MISIGLVGKTNAGKTTFFNSATLLSAEISNRPFTTAKPNIGKAYVRILCVCKELGVNDNPQNSSCIGGWRFVPIQIIDIPGLIKNAWVGRGLGNQFLSVVGRADGLLHIVDASGSINEKGEIDRPGTGDPLRDLHDIEEELVLWFANTLKENKEYIIRQIQTMSTQPIEAFYQILTGLKVRREHILRAFKLSSLKANEFDDWTDADLRDFAKNVRILSKPTLIIANKMDLSTSEDNLEKLREAFETRLVIPCSAESELALRRAEMRKLVKYVPGEEIFCIVDEERLTPKQLEALKHIHEAVFSKWIQTGVQFALDTAVFKLLRMNAVYPVSDAKRLSDKKGNILPDVFLTPIGETVHDLAIRIHKELAKTMIYALDARNGSKLPKDYILRNRDIITIIAAAKRK
jgi:ribosome-binding ATPase YchF (GTP1/OBG family)